MKIIDRNGRLFGKISVIDVLVIAVVLVMAAALYFKNNQAHTGAAVTEQAITFQVRDHAIRFLSSDCPDKVCVNTGFLRNDLDVASCLPNRTSLFVSVQAG